METGPEWDKEMSAAQLYYKQVKNESTCFIYSSGIHCLDKACGLILDLLMSEMIFRHCVIGHMLMAVNPIVYDWSTGVQIMYVVITNYIAHI